MSVLMSDVSWHEKVLFAVDVLHHPDRHLRPPDAPTSLPDLLSVKSIIDPLAAEPAILLSRLLSVTPLLFHELGNAGATGHRPKIYTERIVGPDNSPVRIFASRVAGGERSADEKKEQMGERLHAFLNLVDKAIVEQHRQGENHERLVFSSDFGEGVQSRGLHVPELLEVQKSQVGLLANEPGLFPGSSLPDVFSVQVAFVEHLPSSHALRQWPQEDYYRIDSKPAVILGPEAATLRKHMNGEWQADGNGGQKWVDKGHYYDQQTFGPRSFYERSYVEYWTRLARVRQLVHQKQDALRLNPDQFREISENLAAIEKRVRQTPRPRPQTAPPPPLPLGEDWAERTLHTLDVLEHPEHFFVGPPPDAALEDLLTVRDALHVAETDIDPLKDASRRLMGRLAGIARRDELVDLLTGLMVGLDRAAVVELNQGLLWAAGQAAKKARGKHKAKVSGGRS